MRRIGRSTEDFRDRVEDLLVHAGDLRDRSSKLLAFRKRREAERRYREA
jgi:hypothetical protein